MKRFRSSSILVAAGVLLAATAVSAQTYPTRYVRIVTAGPGTFHDIVARHLAHRLGERWGQPVVVENIGSGLAIATGMVTKAPPDGYTLLIGDRASLAVAPSLSKNLRYDPAKDLLPITLIARAPTILAAHPPVPASNLREFVAYARQLPDPIHLASAGVGTMPHLTGAQFGQLIGIKVLTVQYKGGAQAAMGVLRGEAKFTFLSVPVVLPQIGAGQLKAFAVTSARRFSGAPDIPTAAEAGLPGLEAEQWIALLAPAGTPAAIVEKLNRDTVDVLRPSAFQEMLRTQGAEAAPGTPAELAAFMASETLRLKTLVETTGLVMD
jgi:tripartite-type tricarboxylate transporter receptor subunit TctC